MSATTQTLARPKAAHTQKWAADRAPTHAEPVSASPPAPPTQDMTESAAMARIAAFQSILLQRYVATVSDLVRHLSEETVRRALEQNTGLQSLAVGMGEHAVATASETAHEESERILDLHRAQASLIQQSGGTVTATKAAELLGQITRQAVEKRRERGTLLAIMVGGEYRYPLFQFDSQSVLPGLQEVLKAFTVRSGWTQLSVLISPQDALDGRSLVDALKQGDVKAAVSVAATFGDTGG